MAREIHETQELRCDGGRPVRGVGQLLSRTATGVLVPAFFLESELGDKGLVVKSHLPVFGFGFALALVVGWVAFPRALYVQREQPLDFFHKTHAEKSGLSQCDTCHLMGSDGAIQRNPPHRSLRRLSRR